MTQVLLADKGFSGKVFAAATAAAGITLLRSDRKDETYRNGNLGGVRQWIESVNQTIKGRLNLEQGGRTTHGVFTRVAQRLLAMAAAGMSALLLDFAAVLPPREALANFGGGLWPAETLVGVTVSWFTSEEHGMDHQPCLN